MKDREQTSKEMEERSGELKHRVPELFGSLVFNEEAMEKWLPEEVCQVLRRTSREGRRLNPEIADVVAAAMKDWALEKGATHYTHWFQPLTGITAEKHEGFIAGESGGRAIMHFSGKNLVQGESDASSFPHGGLRSTFEARGYTAWDPSSYAFIKDNTLCIPTVFYSFGGEALDKKTPLLRSVEAINRHALRILKLFGHDDVKKIEVTVGAEQEYFLISRKKYYQRQDLVIAGRTLFGAKPPKGQEMEDHYFGTIKPRVQAFMKDLDEELWKLGILAKTEHNEAAPAQHELAPIFTNVNRATDDNQLTMEIMKKVARRHELACLLHEKPFEGVNGSGKHNNWSIQTDTGINLLEPGDSPQENAQFLLFLAALIQAVDDYQDLLRVSVASANNDHRLGGNEAPPAIISMFLGDELTEILETLEKGESMEHRDREVLRLGVHILPRLPKDTTDRNRTSPFAFTGNKFEFRMPGAGSSIASPNVVLNTIVAESLDLFATRLEEAAAEGQSFEDELNSLIKETITAHKRIIFNGNNYSKEWREEAKARGLCNLATTVDAIPAYLEEKNITLFQKHKIFSQAELQSRYEISMESYSKIINVEALTMVDMAKKQILPAVSGYTGRLLETARLSREVLGQEESAEKEEAGVLAGLSLKAQRALKRLEEAIARAQDLASPTPTLESVTSQAKYYKNEVLPAMEELREIADRMEEETAEAYWPYPTYSKLLFYV